MGLGLVGRTLGVGRHRQNRRRAFWLIRPFDMKLIAHDPNADSKLADELGVELVRLEDVFRRSDIVSVNCPLTPETRHLVDAERLALMKPTSYFINTARGPIVDQKALTKALQERRMLGAGLDVLETEPPDDNDPILKLDNVIFAPHALCWTDQCFVGNGAATFARCWTFSMVASHASSSTAKSCKQRLGRSVCWSFGSGPLPGRRQRWNSSFEPRLATVIDRAESGIRHRPDRRLSG